MLRELSITDLAIIDRLSIKFCSGLNILSGETGAGKSIVVQATALLSGARGSPELIRTGADQLRIDGLFDVVDEGAVARWLIANDCWDEDGELVVTRTIGTQGRSKALINGHIVPLQQLKDLAIHLFDLTGQHQQQTLLDTGQHLLMLDLFGGLNDKRERFAAIMRELKQLRKHLGELIAREAEKDRRIDTLHFQIDEISRVDPTSEEDDTLEAERRRLQFAADLIAKTQAVDEILYSGDGSVSSQLNLAQRDLEAIAKIDEQRKPWVSQLESLRFQADDLARQVISFGHTVSVDPERLSVVNDRVSDIHRLKRKYGPTLSDVLLFRDRAMNELADLEQSVALRDDLERRCQTLSDQAVSVGRELTALRSEVAAQLSSRIESLMQQLEMPCVRFIIDCRLRSLEAADETGLDEVEFLISANPGEPPKSLAKIASGGELSRMMLAIKNSLAAKQPSGTYVFDEVDSGIGGRTAQTVGAHLKRLARRSQVLCITHLPQIACFADHHIRVLKRVADNKTEVAIDYLDPNGKAEEIARMVGGGRMTPQAMDHARELIGFAASVD